MGVYYIGSIPCSGGDIYHYGRKGMKWGKNIFGKISEFFTGNNARRELASATAQRNGARTQERIFGGNDNGGRYQSHGTYLYNPTHTKRGFLARTKDGQLITGAGEEGRLAVAQEKYDKTLPGMMSKAREKVSTAYADAAAAIGKKGLDIQSFYSQVMQKAQGAINQGKNMVSKYGGQFVSQIQTLGSNALAGGKNFLEGIMKKAKQAKSKATEPISRLKARKAEKRDREREIGLQDTHDMLRRRRNYREGNVADWNKGSRRSEAYSRSQGRPVDLERSTIGPGLNPIRTGDVYENSRIDRETKDGKRLRPFKR